MATSQPFDLSGRTAVVTGGGSGLGFAIARGFAQAGARVVINGRNRAKLDAAAAQLVVDGHAVSVAAFDVTDEAAVIAGMADIGRVVGPVDILVNNAAINIRKPFDQYTLAEWRTLQEANFDGPFLVTRTVVPGMKARRRG
jgi:gluconate 5-dehydrogenase